MEDDPTNLEWAILRSVDTLREHTSHLTYAEQVLGPDSKIKPEWRHVLDFARWLLRTEGNPEATEADTVFEEARARLANHNLVWWDAGLDEEKWEIQLTKRGDQYIADVLRSRGPIGIAEERRNRRLLKQMCWRTWVSVGALAISFLALSIAVATFFLRASGR